MGEMRIIKGIYPAFAGVLAGLGVAWLIAPCPTSAAAPEFTSQAHRAPASVHASILDNTTDQHIAYTDYFTNEAMRVDLIHSGTAKHGEYSLDEIVWEPIWPGTRRYLIDPFGYGTFRFRIVDAASNTEVFRMGYSTLFEEWASTEEAKEITRSMHESVRFPWPKKAVNMLIEQRMRNGKFKQVFHIKIDPASHQIRRTRKFSSAKVLQLLDGPMSDRALDVVIVPEGYSARDEAKLRADLERFAHAFSTSDPFRVHKSKLHLRGIIAFSNDSGVAEPRKGIFPDTLLGATFNTFDSPRYLTVPNSKTLREVASVAPYDSILVMVNSSRYGGGGVFNQWAVFTSDNEYDDYVMLHEFGHSMGGLGDEYYDEHASPTAMDEDTYYPPGQEPWEPNLSAFLGRDRKRIKWNELIDPQTPVPTPAQLSSANTIGLFEGAGYKAKGLFRSQLDCKMFHKGRIPFCAVCEKSIEKMMRYHAGEDLTQ